MLNLRNLTAAVAGLGALLFAGAGAADMVELKTKDGVPLMRGDLRSYDDQFLELKTVMGMIRVPRSMADCFGPGCPSEDAAAAPGGGAPGAFAISGMQEAGDELLMQLVGGYLQDIGGAPAISFDPANRAMVIAGMDQSGAQMVEVSLRRRDSASALGDLLSGDAQVAITTRRPTDEERFAFASAGLSRVISGDTEAVLALEGATLVTSPDGPVRSLSLDEAAEIFSGQVNNWAAYGGPDAPIRLIAPRPNGPAVGLFAERALAPRGLTMSPRAETVATEAEVVDAVAADPNAIGLVGLADRDRVRSLPIRLSCGLVAEPSAFSMKSEEYPLVRRLYVYFREEAASRGARQLIAFARSDAGQRRMREAGYIDQGLERRSMNEFGTRLAASLTDATRPAPLALLRVLAAELIDADQYSTTLRFRSGAAVPDSRAQQDMARLAEIFQRPEFREKDIMLVGYTDGIGRFDTNVNLSQRRATQVRDEIISASGGRLRREQFSILGVGPTAPVGCNSEIGGRDANRRVEVWIRSRR